MCRDATWQRLLSKNETQPKWLPNLLSGGADFGQASDTLTLTSFAWAEAAHLETLDAKEAS